MSNHGLIFTLDSPELSNTWEEKAKAFAEERDQLVHRYRTLQKDVAETLKNTPPDTADEISVDLDYITESMYSLFIETLEFINPWRRTFIDKTRAGYCFQKKIAIIASVLDGIAASDSVRRNDYCSILIIVRTHLGRLTLDPYSGWDTSAESMNERADKVFFHYLRLAVVAGAHKSDSSRIHYRDMRWFYDCWKQVNWYEPECDCPQCSPRVRWCALREISWPEEDDENTTGTNTFRVVPGTDILSPRESWSPDMNSCLGETF